MEIVKKRDYKKIYKNSLIYTDKAFTEIKKKKLVSKKNILVLGEKDEGKLEYPDTVFVCIGLRDVLDGDVTVKEYREKFAREIEIISSRNHKTRMFICLLPIPREKDIEKNANLKKISLYNEIMKEEARDINASIIYLPKVRDLSAYKPYELKVMLNKMAGDADL